MQAALAVASWQAEAERTGLDPQVVIREAERFYAAEAYHQKHTLRGYDDIEAEFTRVYPDPDDFAASTATARCNGILAGHGTWEVHGDEIGDYGLSAIAIEELERHLR